MRKELLDEELKLPPLPLRLNFFAKDDGGEKTEKATPRKKKKSREEGQVAKSQELPIAFAYIGLFSGLRIFGGFMLNNILQIYSYLFDTLLESGRFLDDENLNDFITFLFSRILLIIAPMLAIALIIGIIMNLVQVGWHPTSKPMKPKFSKLNPLKGIKRMFSMQTIVNFVKSLAKLAIISLVIYFSLVNELHMVFSVLDMGLFESISYLGNLMTGIGINVGLAYLAIAAADIGYTRFKHAKDLRMSKQEVKEEYKTVEGNPQIKGQIRRRMQEASMRRMMSKIPQADVIITNPTHYAVALQYDRSAGAAPVLVAKGVDFLAQRIKAIGKENNVVIVENKPLARTIYATVEIGAQIPPELYKSVAEILAYVYKLKETA